MSKIDRYVEKLLVFMSSEIEDNATPLNNTIFDFHFSQTVIYFNADDEKIPEGEDLIAYKKMAKLSDNILVEKILNKAFNEKYITYRGMGNRGFKDLQLTENGFRMAKAIRLNQKSKYSQFLIYTRDKILVPFVVSVITAISIFYVMSYLKANEQILLKDKVEKLEKEIAWIKQKQ